MCVCGQASTSSACAAGLCPGQHQRCACSMSAGSWAPSVCEQFGLSSALAACLLAVGHHQSVSSSASAVRLQRVCGRLSTSGVQTYRQDPQMGSMLAYMLGAHYVETCRLNPQVSSMPACMSSASDVQSCSLALQMGITPAWIYQHWQHCLSRQCSGSSWTAWPRTLLAQRVRHVPPVPLGRAVLQSWLLPGRSAADSQSLDFVP